MDLPPHATALKAAWVSGEPPDAALVLEGLAPEAHWVARLYAARLAPTIVWSDPQPAIDRLLTLADGDNAFVRAWALDALARFAIEDATLRERVLPRLTEALATGSGAVRARVKAALRDLE